MKKVWNLVLAMSWPTIWLVLAGLLIVGLMTYRLASITPGLAQIEVETYQSASSLGAIFDNSVNAPYKTAVYAVTTVSESAFALRLVGAIAGILTVGTFFLFVRRLLSPAIAIAITIMFASSSVLLHTVRLASPELMLLFLLPVIAVGFLLRFHKNNDLAWILAAVVIALSLYVPGLILFVLIAATFQFRHVRKSFEQLKSPTIIIASVVFSLLLAPLAINLIRDPGLWREYLGIPSLLPSIGEYGSNLASSLLAIFVYTKPDPVTHIGRQPLLDIFTAVLFIYGLIVIIRQYRLDRFWTILGVLCLGVLWVALTANQANLILVVPFVYLLAGIGLQRLLNEWQQVFPRNPIANSIGYAILFSTVILAFNLHTQRYFQAWPKTDETRQAFTEQLPK